MIATTALVTASRAPGRVTESAARTPGRAAESASASSAAVRIAGVNPLDQHTSHLESSLVFNRKRANATHALARTLTGAQTLRVWDCLVSMKTQYKVANRFPPVRFVIVNCFPTRNRCS